MNSRLNERKVIRTAKRIRGLAGLAILALVCAGAAWSQVNSSSARPAAAATSPGVQSSGVAQNSLAKSPAPKGEHEGITVHGHWTIEVKNPDGSLAKHVEFENSLVTPTNFPLASMTGSQALVALLSGSASLNTTVTGATGTSPWLIDLESLNSGDVSPCGATSLLSYGHIAGMPGSSSASCPLANTAVIPMANAVLADQNTALPGYTDFGLLPGQLTISGSSTVPQQGTIDTVVTIIDLYGLTKIGPSPTSSSTAVFFPFTSATLAAQGSGTCGGAGQPPCAVAVAANQTVSATVTISFQ